MSIAPTAQLRLQQHVDLLRTCRLCPKMQPPPVSGGAVFSKVLLVGQAPGIREPVAGRPFAWTAGRTLFGWFQQTAGISEAEFRASIYMAAVCRCFPGRNTGGGDRVPDAGEISNCSRWLRGELEILRPELILPVGKLAISQFLEIAKLDQIIGRKFEVERDSRRFDVIPLPHPSGASPWHRIEPGRSLLAAALQLVIAHRAWPFLRGGIVNSDQ